MPDVIDLLAPVPTGVLIGGMWRTADSGETFSVENPATGQLLAEVANASVSDGLAALDAAVDAAEKWAATPSRVRSEILLRAFDLLVSQRERFAQIMTREMGKPFSEALGEVDYGGEFLRWYSESAAHLAGRYGPNPEGSGTMIISEMPVGPCLLITPWNFALAMVTRKIAPALAAGCTVILKPAELTPLTALALAELFREAGLPAGVLNVIPTTDAAEVCAAIISDPRLRKVSFTGSTPVGRALIAQSAENVLRTSMELGGNAPFIVFEDADLDRAVDGAIAAKFRNSGQACTAANRFLVHQDLAEDFTSRIVARVAQMKTGDGMEPGIDIGPLINARAVAKVNELVQDAASRGATIELGGHELDGPGSFYAPTVLSSVPHDSRLLREEIFGPVLAITTFQSEAEAVSMANDTEFGLVSYVYTQDVGRAQRMISVIETGMMGINAGVVSNAAAPFGGVKQSGLGKEGGIEGIEEYLTKKYSLMAN